MSNGQKKTIPMEKTTIMVVDDTPANLKLLQDMLQSEGYRVLTFPRGQMALNAAAKSAPDLILLDIRMPHMDGFEVCNRLKSDDRLKEIPVIFISALNETSDKINAFSAGGVDYVTKPFQFEEVHARVKAHLEISRQKRELQDAYHKLQELETFRDSLVHMIVHDMRSPLMVILGNLQIAQLDPMPVSAAECIVDALNAVKRINTMVSNLLDVSKMESGQMILNYSTFDLIILAKDTINMFVPQHENRVITVISRSETVSISADSNLIQRVLQNFIDNAIKFTDTNSGIITVQIENKSEKKIRVSVSDNGHGIPLEYQDRVFDKFFQVQGGKNVKVHSSGLGMTFCKLAIEAHGGRIGLQSEVDKGTTFWFELSIPTI
ncbi:MAG: hybrid sensor histidine kinase/response regulator [Desulfobacterales bacterium]|nr:hybrid sensor histidine kinase/response regulator [Desulfobacterales bacterium]